MTSIVLVVLVFIAIVIAVDARAAADGSGPRARSTSGGWSPRVSRSRRPAVLTAALASALTREPPVRADLYVSLTESLEVANLRPRMRDGCEVKIFRLRWGNDYAMLARDDRELHYRLEVWEAELLPKMDGTRTVGELVVERMEAGGGLDAEPVTDLVAGPVRGRLPRSRPHPDRRADRRPARSLVPGPEEAEALRQDPLDRLEGRGSARPLLLSEPPAALLLVARRVWSLASSPSPGWSRSSMSLPRGRFSTRARDSAPAEAAILLALAFFLTFMHELGHAVVISRYDRKVKSAGFMIYFGAPAFFVEATDSLMLDRRQRILQVVRRTVHGADHRRGCRRSPSSPSPDGPARGPALQVRAPELPRDLPEPDPVAGARRVLDPLRR